MGDKAGMSCGIVRAMAVLVRAGEGEHMGGSGEERADARRHCSTGGNVPHEQGRRKGMGWAELSRGRPGGG